MDMALTPDEAREIADRFLLAAQAVDEYLDTNYQKISRAQYEFINESFKTLLRVSTIATTIAVGLAIDALQQPAVKLKNVIEQTKEQIKILEAVGRVINLVAGLTNLAGAIVARDPNAIVTSVSNLYKLLNA
jgi:hypothetical protein